MNRTARGILGAIVGHLCGVYSVWLAYGAEMHHGDDLALFGAAFAGVGGIIGALID